MRSIPIAANGQSPFSSGFVLDGADDKDSFIGEAVVNPPLDSIEEMKFINQNYDAEFGAAIAGVTVMTTKSGSNSFHGDVYDFRRSDAQQARDPFTQYPGNNPIGPDCPPHLVQYLRRLHRRPDREEQAVLLWGLPGNAPKDWLLVLRHGSHGVGSPDVHWRRYRKL